MPMNLFMNTYSRVDIRIALILGRFRVSSLDYVFWQPDNFRERSQREEQDGRRMVSSIYRARCCTFISAA